MTQTEILLILGWLIKAWSFLWFKFENETDERKFSFDSKLSNEQNEVQNEEPKFQFQSQKPESKTPEFSFSSKSSNEQEEVQNEKPKFQFPSQKPELIEPEMNTGKQFTDESNQEDSPLKKFLENEEGV